MQANLDPTLTTVADVSVPNSGVTHIVRKLVTEARRAMPGDLSSVEQCLDCILLILSRSTAPEASARPDIAFVTGGLAPWQILRAKALIEARLGERLTTMDLAVAVRLSEGHFTRAFRLSLGKTPHQYLSIRRVVRAKRLMSATDEPLAEIALACGLADQAHLSRIFRRFEGDSPNAWRRRSRLSSAESESIPAKSIVLAGPIDGRPPQTRLGPYRQADSYGS